MSNFKELLVWQKSVDFVTTIYRITSSFPAAEKFGLTNQLRRAAVSIPSNIAEGNLRRSNLDYLQFLKIARGSCGEIETQLIISKNLGILSLKEYEILERYIIEIIKMLNGLISAIKNK